MTVKTQFRILVVAGCGLLIVTIIRYAIEPPNALSTGATVGNLVTSGIMLYLAKKLNDKSKRDKTP